MERELEGAGYITRTYIHRDNRSQLNMFVLVGLPGPTSAHTPDVCYNALDYKTIQESQRWTCSSGSQEHACTARGLSHGRRSGSSCVRIHVWSWALMCAERTTVTVYTTTPFAHSSSLDRFFAITPLPPPQIINVCGDFKFSY